MPLDSPLDDTFGVDSPFGSDDVIEYVEDDYVEDDYVE